MQALRERAAALARLARASGVALLMIAGSLLPAQGRAEAPPPAPVEPPELRDAESAQLQAAVRLDGRTLFRVGGVSSYPAEERAQAIEARILAFARDESRRVEELHLASQPHFTVILAGSERIAAVHDVDAALERVDRESLAQINLARLREAVSAYRSERSAPQLLRHSAHALLATLLLAAMVYAIVALERALKRRIRVRYGRALAELEGRSKSLVRAQWVAAVLRGMVNTVALVLVAVLFLAWLGFVLESFPWTRPTGERMVALFMEPLARFGRDFLAALPGLVFLVVLFVVVRALLGFLRATFDSVRNGTVRFESFDPEWAEPTYKIVRLLVIILALVVAYPYVPGSGSEAFKGLSLLLGVMLSLGSSSIVSNLIAGYTMTYRRAFRRGDLVRVGDVTGFVTNMRLQVTHLRNMRNEEIIVPNSEIIGSTVVNYTSLGREDGLMIATTVGIGYETPWRQVESLLLMAAGRTAGVRREPAAFVLIPQLGDFCVTYELNVAIADPGTRVTTLAALNRHVLDVFNEYGVQIMTPAYEGDPATPKVVPRDQWYAAPAAPPAPEAQPPSAG